MATLVVLPAPSELSGRLLAFLDDHFKTPEDLHRATALLADLGAECDALERSVSLDEGKLSLSARAWATRAEQAMKALRRLKSDLAPLVVRRSPDENEVANPCALRRILATDIPVLAKQLDRIEKIRLYAETTLHVEALMGDLEDAALCIIGQGSSMFLPHDSDPSSSIGITWKQEKLLFAIKIMKDIEKILLFIGNAQPQWSHLSMAIHLRVGKILAILRPKALADHRLILACIGWPPPLATSISGCKSSPVIPNPLVMMEEDKRKIYSESFLALLALQVLQDNLERRKHKLVICQKNHIAPCFTKIETGTMPEYSIWAVDELVYPIALKAEHHFSRWDHQPEFIFALTYRIIQNLLEGVDCFLQPLIDKARLAGFSAKEAWISAVVKMLIAYLRKRTFPDLFRRYGSEQTDQEVISLWRNIFDLIITFDRKMRAVATPEHFNLSGLTEFGEILSLKPLSVLSIFCNNTEWIEFWAQIELKNAQDTLKNELDNDEAWVTCTQQETEFFYGKTPKLLTFYAKENYKAPPVADSVIRMAWAMIEKGWALPCMHLKVQFIRSSANTLLHLFSNMLRQQCQEFQVVSIMDDSIIKKAASRVNAARYCESIMLEWSEYVNFLEMCRHGDNDNWENESSFINYFFANEIEFFSELQTDCLMQIISALLLEFDYRCYDYTQSSKKWGDLDEPVEVISIEPVGSVSTEFIEALDMLMDRLQVLRLYLNFKDFHDLWRSVAGGLDYFIFRSILWSNARLSNGGVHQLKTDMSALFYVFKSLCIRPEAFFPYISDCLKLFAMTPKDVKCLMVALKRDREEKCFLRLHGIFHISAAEAEKILNRRQSPNVPTVESKLRFEEH